ncbi:MAG: hypothetical protein ACYC61_04195 [Isosphaeraceae bacterium]
MADAAPAGGERLVMSRRRWFGTPTRWLRRRRFSARLIAMIAAVVVLLETIGLGNGSRLSECDPRARASKKPRLGPARRSGFPVRPVV